jgi:TatD family-associated radical SAM protein
MRLDLVKAVAKNLKERGIRVRLVTNGHGDLINSRPIASELKGLIDKVSVSLNIDSKDKYNEICCPTFGEDSYDAVLKFAKDCVASGIETELTCLDLPGSDLAKCAATAETIGASFRKRSLGVVG